MHYSKLAEYYDAMYDTIVDYESQTVYLEKIFEKFHGGKVKNILDVGCGTGNFTYVFAKRGYNVTGIDLSPEMIKVARRKSKNSKNPRFFEIDMRDIKLDKKFDAVACLFGGFGYLLNFADVRKFFASAKSRLSNNGLLLFEFWHVSALRPEASSKAGFRSYVNVLDKERRIVRLDTNHYDPQTNICNVTFETYVLNTKTKKLLDSFTEEHKLKVYSISEMKTLLEDAGYKSLGFYEVSFGASKKIESAGQSTFRVLALARA